VVETAELTIDSTRADEVIGWSNAWDWRETLRRTLDWYLDHQRGSAAHPLVRRDLADYYSTLGAEAAWSR
jgi:dTDP-D-glucose 4,6-dehydratase